jgi:hypothetical protein
MLQFIKIYNLHKYTGPGSSVGIATELRAGRSAVLIPVEARISGPVPTAPGAHPPSCTMITSSFPGLKRPGRVADKLSPISSVFKKE